MASVRASEDLERTLALRQHSLETGERYESEHRLRNSQTGEYRWLLARAYPMCDEAGQIIKLVWHLHRYRGPETG